MRKFDNDGWIFVTERDTKKYKDFVSIFHFIDIFKAIGTRVQSPNTHISFQLSVNCRIKIRNPSVAVTFLWLYMMEQSLIIRQVSIFKLINKAYLNPKSMMLSI